MTSPEKVHTRLRSLVRVGGAAAEENALVGGDACAHCGQILVGLFSGRNDVVEVLWSSSDYHHVVGEGSRNGVLVFHVIHPWT